MKLWALTLALTTMAFVAGARADVIEVGQCEHGWTWQRVGHGGACGPTLCTTSADCGGAECREVARCMRTSNVDTGQGGPSDPPATYEVADEALCAADGTCGGGAHCGHARECQPRSGGCSVGVGAHREGPPVLAIALGALAVISRACRGARRGG